MAFASFDSRRGGVPMAEINMIPLIDVMLVLLVIFIITAPLMTHAIRLDLPKVAAGVARDTPQSVTLSIDDAGKLYWDDTPVALDALPARFQAAAAGAAPPELRLRASRATRYDVIAQVMGAAQAAGLTRIGFVTDVPPAGAAAPAAAGAKP